MPTWLHTDNTTKQIVTFGLAPTPEVAQMQTAPSGLTLYVLPDGLLGNVFNGTPDLSRLVAAMVAKIDAEAEQVRLQFITPGAGQMMSYLQKREEAAAWAANNSATVPVIQAEATALGKTVAAVVAEVQAAAALWVAGEAMINATRLSAKKAITEADNVPDIIEAATINWAALAASIPTGG